jgi:subtilisin family serine protease
MFVKSLFIYLLLLAHCAYSLSTYATELNNKYNAANNLRYKTADTNYFTYSQINALNAKENQLEKLKVIVEFSSSPIVKSRLNFASKKNNKASYSKELQSQLNLIDNEQNSVLRSVKLKGIAQSYDRKFNYLYNGASLSIDRSKLSELKRIAGIKKVHIVRDKAIQLHDSISLIKADQVWNLKDNQGASLTGKGVKVAILDTGIDYTRAELGGCFGADCRVVDGYDFMNDDNDPMDDQGHGTHVAGIVAANGEIKGVAPEATLYAYKICDYSCPTDGTIAALEKAIDPDGDPSTDDGVDIINMSIGGPGGFDDPLTVAVNNLADENILVVISAGNEGDGAMTVTSPGNAARALTVASTDKNDNIASYSSRGPILSETFQKPEISAPGSDITSLAIGSGNVSMSGTSMAAPHVAGAAALVKQQYPELTGQEIKTLLISNTDSIDYPFATAGSGRLNVLKAIGASVLTNKSYLLFERLDRSVNEITVEGSIELTNISNEEQSITLDFANETVGITYSILEEEEITLAANQTQTITVSLLIDTETLAYTESLLHRANLNIKNDTFTSSVPILVFDAIKLDWVIDQYSDSVWIHNKDTGKSRTINYGESGSEFLLPGSYFFSSFVNYGDSYAVVVKELSDVSQDTEVSVTQSEATHKIQISEFADHLGNTKSIDDLYGGGTYVEVAYPKNLERQFHFWAWQDSGYFSRYPVYVSDLPEGLEFNFSFLAGDKTTVSADYHAYVYTESLSNIGEDISFEINGLSEKKVKFDVVVPDYYQESMSWRLFNILEIDPYNWPQGWTRYAYWLEGPSAQMNSDQVNENEGAFKLTLHGNEFSNERFGFYALDIGSWPENQYESSRIKFEEEGNYSLYNYQYTPAKLIKNAEEDYRIAGEGTFPETSLSWNDNYISIGNRLLGHNNLSMGRNQFESALFICDRFVVKQVNDGFYYDDSPDNWPCNEKRIDYQFYNYLYGKKQLSKYTSDGESYTEIRHMELLSDVSSDSPDVIDDFVEITLMINYSSSLDNSFTAWGNTSGAWDKLETVLVDSQKETWPYTANYRILLPQLEIASLISLNLEFDDGSDNLSLVQPNAYLIGGTKEGLISLDNDGDGINDLDDYDRDNDGIPDDIEILNGLNHLDASDASGDVDGDGVSNIDEYQAGRFISYLEDDRDEDGVADHLDAFPDDSSEAYDTDGDGIGNNADTDDDNDGVEDELDAFPLDPDETIDTDGDGIGNNADVDDDGDGVHDESDAFPFDPYETEDTDNDGIGNNADTDDDNDGVEDDQDAFSLDPNESVDTDNDGIGNNADTDDDNDGVEDSLDTFPLDPNESVDTDNDGIGNNTDTDDDNDGVEDSLDAFPLDPNESIDTDGDGVGNNNDGDDDGDGVPDSSDTYPLDSTRSSQPVINNATDSSGDSSGGTFGYLLLLLILNIYRKLSK